MTGDDPRRRLHALPPGEFTAARNRLVAELRKAGRDADARAVARLRKPSAALWAVNRLADLDRPGVAAFIDAVERLRRAQLREPRAAVEALRAQRAALERLVERAGELLRRSRLPASPSILRRVADTLRGAAADRTAAADLRRGAVAGEMPAPGFEAFGGARPSAAPLRLVSRRDGGVVVASRDEEARRAQAVAAAESLERQAREHEATLARLNAERAEAEARVAELGKRVTAARRVARRTKTAAGRARRKATRR